MFAHPFTLAAGPLQAERPELTLHYKSLTLRDFVASLRHPSGSKEKASWKVLGVKHQKVEQALWVWLEQPF